MNNDVSKVRLFAIIMGDMIFHTLVVSEFSTYFGLRNPKGKKYESSHLRR